MFDVGSESDTGVPEKYIINYYALSFLFNCYSKKISENKEQTMQIENF